jgi:hypothetical protein
MRSLFGLVIVLVLSAAARGEERWRVPAAGPCTPGGGRVSTERAEDATAFPFRVGDTIAADRLPALKSVLPPFVWSERERFFYEGARLEIGPCFRDYSPPAFYREATRAPARLGAQGELEGYGIGLPFPPAAIGAKDPRAGEQWLWNVEQRYQGAGFHGRFRLTDVTGGEAEPFEGEIFKVAVAHRADLAGPEHAVDGVKGKQWVAGGEFDEPFSAKDYAWRQFRDEESFRDPDRADELHAYLPQWRRVRRLSAAHVDGLFVPSPAIAAAQANQVAVGAGPVGASGGGEGGSGASGGGAGSSASGAGIGIPSDLAAASEPLHGGFEAFGLRPNLYDVDVVGLHDVLAPINVARPMWPAAENRDFGPSGLSLANDRWELRRAIVLDARRRGSDSPSGRFRVYADLQTLQPLYLATYDANGELADVAIFASRWSEDRPDYPRWADGGARPVRVLDPVATVIASARGKGGWRRESWEMVSTPPKEAELRRMISVGELTRGQ